MALTMRRRPCTQYTVHILCMYINWQLPLLHPQLYAQKFGSITGFKFLSDMILLSLVNKVSHVHWHVCLFTPYLCGLNGTRCLFPIPGKEATPCQCLCVRGFFSQVGHSGWYLRNAENVNVHTYVYINATHYQCICVNLVFIWSTGGSNLTL